VKVLVTGGAGYIGSMLCEELLKVGHYVICLDRVFFGLDLIKDLLMHQNFTLVRDDIRTVDKSVFQSVDVVMDLAGISNDPACDLDPCITEEINHQGTVRVARLAKETGVKRYILSSSCSIYGTGVETQLTENSITKPVSLYAKSKLEAESSITGLTDDHFCVTILRNATVYGLSRRMRFDLIINIMTLHAYTKRKIYVLGGGQQWRPNVHLKDVCKAFIMTMETPQEKINGEVFNVGSNEQNFQVIQVANMIRDVVPYTEVEIISDDPDKRNYNVSFDKISRVLNYKVERSVMEGAVEVKQALERGQISGDDMRTSTLKYYRYLLDAERILKDVYLKGRLL
jgi:nucleoside-diphosphate-sugar epimerase